jgi:hypothetical protein
MKFRNYLLVFCITFGLLAVHLRSETTLDDLEGLVKTWTALRQEIANEKREWQAQQGFLKSEIQLLEQEIASLETEIQAFEAEGSSEDRKRETQLFRKQELQTEIADLAPMLDRVSAGIRDLQTGLPAGLASQVSFVEKTRIVDRVQALAVALGTFEGLFGELHVLKEMIVDDLGKPREMDVLYLGQSRAFAVSASNDWAGIGVPGSQGWQWTSAPESATAIRRVISIYEETQPAALVELPLQMPIESEVSP